MLEVVDAQRGRKEGKNEKPCLLYFFLVKIPPVLFTTDNSVLLLFDNKKKAHSNTILRNG